MERLGNSPVELEGVAWWYGCAATSMREKMSLGRRKDGTDKDKKGKHTHKLSFQKLLIINCSCGIYSAAAFSLVEECVVYYLFLR